MRRTHRSVGARSVVIALAIGVATIGGTGMARAAGDEPGGPGGTGGGAIGPAPTGHDLTDSPQGAEKLELARLAAAVTAGQATSYYCGPSTAESIVEYLIPSPHSSRYNGTTLSQAHLATSTYLQTDANRGTPWSGRRMPVALNLWTNARTTGWYTTLTAPNKGSFELALTYDVDNSHPFANSTVEIAGDSRHYNQHPVGQTIGHWVPARGYSSSGDRGYFADPAHSLHVTWGYLPSEYFSLDSGAWAAYYLSAHGIVW